MILTMDFLGGGGEAWDGVCELGGGEAGVMFLTAEYNHKMFDICPEL